LVTAAHFGTHSGSTKRDEEWERRVKESFPYIRQRLLKYGARIR